MPNNYDSGGKNFTSANSSVEKSIDREFFNRAGGVGNVKNLDSSEVVNILQNILDVMSNNAQVSREEISDIKNAMKEAVQNAPNVRQGAQAGASVLKRVTANNLELLKGIQSMRGSDKGNGAIGQVNGNIFKQSMQLQQNILSTLMRIDNRLNSLGLKADDIKGIMIDTDNGNDANDNLRHAEEMGMFDSIKHAIFNGIMNSPAATKIGELGAGLMSAGLYQVASNDNVPKPIRDMALGAVYLEIPQTLMNILGKTVEIVLQAWLIKGPSFHFLKQMVLMRNSMVSLWKGAIGGIGNIARSLLPAIGPIIGALLIGAGIFAAIKGIINHRKQMKENDAKIDSDPTLTRGQKEVKKLGAHAKSGATKGILAGALAGAGAGVLMGAAGGPVGMIVGGLIGALKGALIGGLGGLLIGAFKPATQLLKHGFQLLVGGLSRVGKGIMSGAKWALDHREKMMATIKPVLQGLITFMTLVSPIFLLLRMFINKFRGLGGKDFIKGLIQAVKGDPQDTNNDGHPPSTWEKIKSAPGNVAQYIAGTVGANGLVDVRKIGLKGQVWAHNEKPFTKKENVGHLQQLDYLLDSWGFKTLYTSNMGGTTHKQGANSHYAGNKVDLQLTKGGKVAQLEKWQEDYLRKLGYFDGQTGALGYEPQSDGGFHYDMHIGQYVKDDPYFKKLREEQQKKIAEKKAAEEKKKQDAKKKDGEKKPGFFDKMQNIGPTLFPPTTGDMTGMNNYTALENTTNATITQGRKN